MSKRRRTSSATSRAEDESDESRDSSILSPQPIVGRKRKKLDPTELCQQLYDSIRNFKKEDGSTLCDIFIRAPKRRQEPSYYEVVANPIDLLRVQQKLKTDSYDDIEELTGDLLLLVNNAKAFYKPDSVEYQDACALWDVYNTNKNKLLESISQDETPETKTKVGRIGRPRKSVAVEQDDEYIEDVDIYEELFATVMTATDPVDDRLLHLEFQLLPSKKLYPDYYDVIDHPVDLKLIATKIQTSAYTSLTEMEKDLMQMTKNACTFNEPGSQIYKDAKTLKKIFMSRKAEIESGKVKKSSIRKMKIGQSYSGITASLKEEVESSDDDMDDMLDNEGDGPMWQLLDQLYNTANSTDHNDTGTCLGETLWKLPNRRFNLEYYNIVKKPISMAQIRNKLKKGDYINITDMTADIYLMLDNAKKAYGPMHKTHKDAVKMQKLLNQKLVETGVDQEDSDTEDTDSSSIPSTAISTTNGSLTPFGCSEKKKKGRPRLNPLPSTPVSSITPPLNNTVCTTNTPNANMLKGKCWNTMSLKKKLLSLQKYLTEFMYGNRQLMALFMEKPSKKLYPDYYQVIQHPIDMNTIENNIKSERYNTLDDIVGDYRLMFSNCRKYNEESSMIYEDANILEKALNEKLKEFSGINIKNKLTPKVVKVNRKNNPILDAKLRQLYDAIRDYREPKQQRQLALIFMKLPSKNDYPDYYDVIKQPIDMEKIAQKLKLYESFEELASDFMLMFENACKYNEPDSQIYKDALLLQQVCIQTKQALRDGDETIPDVQQAVQELLMSLFNVVYNYQDEEGRCFSDSLAELNEHDEVDGNKVRAISLDLIKRRLDKGLYKRLDIFQEDIFASLDRARKISRTDSQVFEDSVELQSFFIKKRDELCKNGDFLSSPALSYSALHLSAAVQALRQSKLLLEGEETEGEAPIQAESTTDSMIKDQKVYCPGDFVYYELQDNDVPGIIYIERLWTNSDCIKMMYGNVFVRPYETYHVQTRKFMEQEVFKSDQHQAIPLSQLLSRCFVMSVKDYFKYRPEGIADKDVYVCESRYNTRARSFKKIKTWSFAKAKDPVKLITRENQLELKRVMSVFKDRVDKPIKVEISEFQLQDTIIEKEKPNVVVFVNGGEEGNVYYEQYNTVCSGVVKTGDYVYVATESGKQSIAQINSIWETKDGKSFFRGPWILTPSEVPGSQHRLFYRQEVMLSTVQETTPTIAIVGRCAVLDYNEYSSRRPTEISESDIYICEAIFDEMKKQVRRIQGTGSLRKFTHSQMVTPDEIYHFKRHIAPQKVSCNDNTPVQETVKPVPPNVTDLDIKMEGSELLTLTEDSMDGGPPSVGSDVASPAPLNQHTTNNHNNIFTPNQHTATTIKRGKGGKKLVTGYILYSSENRKSICAANPDTTFGDISRIVGNDWKTLPQSERTMWEEKAAKINEENAVKYAEEFGGCASPISQELLVNQAFDCCWDKCDWQFEDPGDCLEHAIADGTGCVQQYFANSSQSDSEYVCLWRGCIRLKKNSPAFPNLVRLIKHVRDIHINKSNGKVVQPQDRSKNYVSSKKQTSANQIFQTTQNFAAVANTQQSLLSTQNLSSVINLMATPPADPLFITVPPRPQRVLHSEAYIKYIEGLQSNTSYISPYMKTIRATQETTPAVDTARLPTQWLGKRAHDKPEAVVNALWQLRDFMMKDVLTIHQSNY